MTWTMLTVVSIPLFGVITFMMWDVWRHCEEPAKRRILARRLAASSCMSVTYPMVLYFAPTLFAQIRQSAPELAQLEGPLMLVAALGVCVMALSLATALANPSGGGESA